VLGDISRLLNLADQEIGETSVTPAVLVELVDLIESGVLSGTMAKSVLSEAFASGDAPGKIVVEKGYRQISDASEVESAVADAIQGNPRAVEDYHRGKESAAGFLVGQVMKLTRGRAKPDLVQRLVRESLESSRSA
jgi:aspartyl-tRNA(Asn)/glutamyl-tRNA(Gln) amidotransferase subunit B